MGLGLLARISTSTYADSGRIIKTYRVRAEAGFEHYCTNYFDMILERRKSRKERREQREKKREEEKGVFFVGGGGGSQNATLLPYNYGINIWRVNFNIPRGYC